MATPATEPSASGAVRAVPAVAAVCTLLVVAGVGSFVVRGAPFQEYFGAWVLQNAPLGLVGVTVFGLALRRQPSNRAAWLFFTGGVIGSVHVASMGWVHAVAERYPAVWGRLLDGTIAIQGVPISLMAPLWIAASLWLLAPGLPVLGLLHFPDGRLPSPRWRPVAWLGVVGLVFGFGAWTWGYRPWSPHLLVFNFLPLDDGVARVLFLVGGPSLGLFGLATIVSLGVRLRSGDPDQRRRVRPAVITGSLFVAVMVLLYPWRPLWAAVSVLVVIVFLLTVAASVARYRLFDVEVAVSRAVTVAVLGLIVTLAYIGLVAGVGGLLGTGSNLWVSVAATAVIAVSFEPLRRQVMAATTRLVLGAQATPYETLAQLSERLARADSTAEVLDRVVELLVDGTAAAAAEVRTLRNDGSTRLDAAAGQPPSDPSVRSAPVAHAGELLGEVRLLAERHDRLPTSDERLLHQVAATLGPVVRNARLTRELHDHIEELRASRQRIVTAHDDARRALERDIHDGAQQQLLSLRLKLAVAATLAQQDGADGALDVITEVAAQTDVAIRQLRDLARGMYPPVLAEQGLEAALRAQARDVPLPVTVEATRIGRYDRAIESTVYFCCLEAMHNASKHAGASKLRIDLSDGDGTLEFAVADDGAGFNRTNTAQGAGMTNMTDRVNGLGGTLEVQSSPARGTIVRGRIPTRADDGQPVVSDK